MIISIKIKQRLMLRSVSNCRKTLPNLMANDKTSETDEKEISLLDVCNGKKEKEVRQVLPCNLHVFSSCLDDFKNT